MGTEWTQQIERHRTGIAEGDLQPESSAPLLLPPFFCQAEEYLEWGTCMRRPSSPHKASNHGLLLTSPNFRLFRTQNNDNTLPGKKKKSPWACVKLAVCCLSHFRSGYVGQPGLLIPCTHSEILCFPPCRGSLEAARLLLPAVPELSLSPWHTKPLHTWEGSRRDRERWRRRGGRGGMCPLLAQGNPQQWGEAQLGLSKREKEDKHQVFSTLQRLWQQPGKAAGTMLSYTHRNNTLPWKQSTAEEENLLEAP